jgi:hypothetical protein
MTTAQHPSTSFSMLHFLLNKHSFLLLLLQSRKEQKKSRDGKKNFRCAPFEWKGKYFLEGKFIQKRRQKNEKPTEKVLK